MFDLILKVEETDIVEFLDVLLEYVGAEIMDILKNLDLELLDAFVDLVILLRDVRLEEESHDMGVQTADGVIVSYLVLQFPADIAQLLLQLYFYGLKVALKVRD